MKKIHLILMLPVFLTGCAGLPSLDDRPESHYLDIRSAPRMDALLNTATAKPAAIFPMSICSTTRTKPSSPAPP